jgi:hypothetical protein
MKKALAGVLAVALVGVIAGSAMAQVPNVQVYFDAAHTQTQRNCGSTNSIDSVFVVMNNWNMNVTGVDFSVSMPPQMIYLADNLPDPSTQTKIGNSPTGIAIAYANCCYLNGFLSNDVLHILFLWGPCDCTSGPKSVIVGGYTPTGKTQPTAIRKEDFQEFAGVGMTSLICPGAIATEPTTWGQVKALYR